VKANRGVRARVPAAGKVLEGDDQPTLSALYYDYDLKGGRSGSLQCATCYSSRTSLFFKIRSDDG